MPTGYTSNLNSGKEESFQEFALKCSRAFGYLIEMRDEPLDATIPSEFIPSSFHFDKLETAKKRLAEIEKWSNTRIEKEAQKAFNDEAQSINQYNNKNEQIAQNYIDMLKQVVRWIPPTKEHECLKSFMTKQLLESLEFDCLGSPSIPKRLSGQQYYKRLLASVRKDLAYHTKMYAEETQRVAKRNKWVQSLRKSLNDFK